MDAKDRLRLFLEQRRELGEQDLVLDQLPVDDVLAILGVRGSTSRAKGASTHKPESSQKAHSGDATGARDTTRVRESRSAHAATEHVAETPASLEAPPPPPAPRFDANATSSDWRATLRASGASGEVTSSAAPLTPAESASSVAPITPVTSTSPSGPAELDAGGAKLVVPPWLAALELPPGVVVGTQRASSTAIDAPASLDDIAASIAHCTACPLHASATRSVPGEGNPQADFVCVGEAPGQNEDESGRPFVGAAGQLLTKILGAIDLKRDDVFICNVLKHRPPGNRNPLPEEVAACRPYLEQQLALLKPRVILALGTFAAQTLLNTTQTLSALRGRLHLYHGVPLIVTYHPAALLRNEAWKRPTWEDVKLARRIHDASGEANPA